jgi:hypothetical protein
MSLIRLYIVILNNFYSLFCESVSRIAFLRIHCYQDIFSYPPKYIFQRNRYSVTYKLPMPAFEMFKVFTYYKNECSYWQNCTDIKHKILKENCDVSLLGETNYAEF